MAQDVLLDARRIHHLAVEVDERLPIGEEEGRVGPDLPPDEHVLGRQRDLSVAVGDVGPHRLEDALLRQVDLRVEVGRAELAAAPAPGRHLDDAEGGRLVRKDQRAPVGRMGDLHPLREVSAVEGLVEQGDRLGRLAPAVNHTVDPEALVRVGLRDLPRTGPAEQHLERLAMRIRPDPLEQQLRVVRVDRLAGAAEDRRVNSCRKRHAERVVGRQGNDLRLGPDEPVDVVRVADDYVVRPELVGHHPLENAQPRRRGVGRTILESLHVTLVF